MNRFKSIQMDPKLINEINQYKEDNHFKSFTQATINLIIKGLNAERKENALKE